MDTESIIRQAAQEAGALDDPDASPAGDTPAEPTPDEPSGDSPAELPAGDAPVETEPPVVAPTADEIKALEEIGLKAPEPGKRDNKLPHSKVVKIVQNAERRVEAKYTAQLAERDTKIKEADAELATYRQSDQLIRTDPDRFMMMLAALHPTFKKFLEPPARPAEPKPAPASAATTQRPAPDVKFEDGSLGYSPEQHDKLLDWVAATAEARAIEKTDARFTERFGPIEKNWKAKEYADQQRPLLVEKLQRASQTWGPLFDEDYAKNEQSEVLAELRAHPDLPFEASVAKVLIPKMQADRNTMRALILKEIDARPKAAVKTPPAAVSSTDTSGAARTAEDIVREVAASLR